MEEVMSMSKQGFYQRTPASPTHNVNSCCTILQNDARSSFKKNGTGSPRKDNDFRLDNQSSQNIINESSSERSYKEKKSEPKFDAPIKKVVPKPAEEKIDVKQVKEEPKHEPKPHVENGHIADDENKIVHSDKGSVKSIPAEAHHENTGSVQEEAKKDHE